MLLSFEGLPGAGKTTQGRLLRDRLAADGLRVAYLPDLGTLSISPLGNRLAALFAWSADPFHRHDHVVTDSLLAAAVRAEIVASVIGPAAAGHEVVAYSLATVLRDYPMLDPAAVLSWLRGAGTLGGPEAELALWLRLPVAAAARRAAGRDGRRHTCEQQSYLGYVDEAYQRMSVADTRLVRVEAGDGSPAEVHTLVYSAVSGWLG